MMLSKPNLSPAEFMQMFKFNTKLHNNDLSKAREIYEQSLLLAKEYIRSGSFSNL